MKDGWIKIHRKIQESNIWEKPAEYLKIWVYILQEVNHKDNKFFTRGTNFFNYGDISRELNIRYSVVEHCTRFLKSAKQIAIHKTTRGVAIKVLNYDRYQGSGETDGEIKAKSKRNQSDTINKNDKNDKNVRKKTTTVIVEKTQEFGNADINSLLQAFEKANLKITAKLKLNRYAANRLIKKYGLQKSIRLAEYALSILGQPYAPQVTNILDLEQKKEKIVLHWQKNNQSKSITI